MTDLFLIAHKVRSEPAFDVAIQMECPHCFGHGNRARLALDLSATELVDCHECDGLGYWWIIPTSGHRAYPYWYEPINIDEFQLWFNQGLVASVIYQLPSMPPSLPDHYPTRTAPTISLIDTLGLRKPKAQATSTPIARRF